MGIFPVIAYSFAGVWLIIGISGLLKGFDPFSSLTAHEFQMINTPEYHQRLTGNFGVKKNRFI